MSSTIFYKFFHQKSQATIHFDGTGINVFDLKHEIITQNQLGDGMDFDLKLYHGEQPDLEYDHDQDVIPRSAFVFARRTPVATRGAKFGNASRYVSGKPRINRKTLATAAAPAMAAETTAPAPTDNMTEEEKIKMMFDNQSSAWAQTQEELAQHKMIYSKPTGPTNPEDMPPPGYMCYRCGGKDHWIKNCPTITDPNYESKKLRKTTGIPRSYLKTVSREAAERDDKRFTSNENGEIFDEQGNKYMITDTGEYVIAMADSKTWNTYQEKQQNAAMQARREFESKIIDVAEKEGKTEFLDPLVHPTKRLLVSPVVMTPCCQDKARLDKMTNYLYNRSDLEQLLIDNDFHCPNCGKEDVFIDSLEPNEKVDEELKAFVDAKAQELGIQDPLGVKREGEHEENGDAKRQKTEVPTMPGVMPPFGFFPGMPFPMMMPMMMPPPPPQAK